MDDASRKKLAVECMHLVERIRGRPVDLKQIRKNDPLARAMFGRDQDRVSRAAFVCAWLATRYPECFFAAVMEMIPD